MVTNDDAWPPVGADGDDDVGPARTTRGRPWPCGRWPAIGRRVGPTHRGHSHRPGLKTVHADDGRRSNRMAAPFRIPAQAGVPDDRHGRRTGVVLGGIGLGSVAIDCLSLPPTGPNTAVGSSLRTRRTGSRSNASVRSPRSPSIRSIPAERTCRFATMASTGPPVASWPRDGFRFCLPCRPQSITVSSFETTIHRERGTRDTSTTDRDRRGGFARSVRSPVGSPVMTGTRIPVPCGPVQQPAASLRPPIDRIGDRPPFARDRSPRPVWTREPAGSPRPRWIGTMF